MALHLLDDEQRITITDDKLDGITGGDADTTYTVRQIPPSVSRTVAKRHATGPFNRQTGQRDLDADKLTDDLLDYALVAWSGIQHQGKSVPCEREYKLLLDYPRKAALIVLAGSNQVNREQQTQSFRSPA